MDRQTERAPRTSEDDATEPNDPSNGRSDSASELEGDDRSVLERAGFVQLFDGTGIPTFVLDADGSVVEWNAAIADLTGVDRPDALGHDRVSELFYPDGRRADTLADKVLEAPERAHTRFGVERRDPARNRYGDTSTMVDRFGDEKHIDFSATPLYDGDDLIGVVEVVVDRTDAVSTRDATVDLVREVRQTADDISGGDLRARASRPETADRLEPELVDVIDAVNDMADSLETLTGRVDGRAREMRDAVEEANAAAADISTNVGDQHDLLEESVEEMQSFAAGMEEVAAQANEVDAAASAATDAAEAGLEAGEDAREATESVVEIGDDLVGTVTLLAERMDDIAEVVEVISDVADETNLLALNANIEAARAGESGGGFAVVADHVKTLADETRGHTEEIEASLEELQEQLDRTIDAVDRSDDRIEHVDDRIETTLESLEEIVDSVDEASHGISEVARVIDDQAATVEELTSTMETVQSHSAESEAATDRIVTATDRQDRIVDGLIDRVEKLQMDRTDESGH
ncbi:methyl-accepting chemotaxis protein [Natrarchaeobius sp. A-rgal3]|uniref:methyl-accepting chemotaxis protein n=1 Tax=Natrarchaeobius versutus TaxID=1679078 RepID=UPI00350FDF4E